MQPTNLVIIEKYDEFVEYIYPCVQNVERKHGVVKAKMLEITFNQVELFYKALKSNQKSKLYEADANLAKRKQDNAWKFEFKQCKDRG